MSDLITLLNITSKQDLKKHCKTATILKYDFSNLVFDATYGSPPINCMSHFAQHEPDHLVPQKTDLQALAENGVGKLTPSAQNAIRKVKQMFNDRKISAGHLFYNNNFSKWHFFYFDQRDTSSSSNSWKQGSHIHFVNWLWPHHNPFQIWSDFSSSPKCPRPKDGMHIRFESNI